MPIIDIKLTNVDSIILSTLMGEMCKVAGKAASNYGKAPAESSIDPVGKEPRKYWLKLTQDLHAMIDALVDSIDIDAGEFNHTLSLDFYSQGFLLKELAAMAQRVGAEAWKQFDAETRDKILRRTSFTVYELRMQIAGVEQLKMFDDVAPNINVVSFQV